MSIRHGWGRRLRNGLVGFLVVLTTISFLAAGLGIWASRNFLDNDVFSERLATVLEEPEVQQALAAFTTNEIITLIDPEEVIGDALPDRAAALAPVLAGQVESFVSAKVLEAFQDPRVHDLFERAVSQSHAAMIDLLEGRPSDVVEPGSDSVTISLIPIIENVLIRISEVSPEIFGRSVDIPEVSVEDVPDEARQKLSAALGVELDDDFGTFTVYDASTLAAAQDAFELFNNAVWLLVVLTVVLMVLTLVVSAHWRRTILQLTAAISLGLIVVRRLSLGLQEELLGMVKIPENVPAVEVVTDRVIDPLRLGAEILLWVALGIILIAVLTGPYPWVVRLRERVASVFRAGATAARDRSQDEETRAWVGAHRELLQWGGAVIAALMILFLDISWFGLLLLAAALAAYEVLVVRLTPDAPPVASVAE